MGGMKRQVRPSPPPAGAASGPQPSAYTDYASCPTGSSAAEFIPKTTSLNILKEAVSACRGCPIYCNATQGFLVEARKGAAFVFVGEQPGDQEDRAGKP